MENKDNINTFIQSLKNHPTTNLHLNKTIFAIYDNNTLLPEQSSSLEEAQNFIAELKEFDEDNDCAIKIVEMNKAKFLSLQVIQHCSSSHQEAQQITEFIQNLEQAEKIYLDLAPVIIDDKNLQLGIDYFDYYLFNTLQHPTERHKQQRLALGFLDHPQSHSTNILSYKDFLIHKIELLANIIVCDL